MPSPFPGMDPFLESQKWKPFHGRFITHLGDALVARLRPRYVVETEDYVYVSEPEGDDHAIAPDLYVADTSPDAPRLPASMQIVGDQVPVLVALPAVAPSRQRSLVIRRIGSDEVVTVIELLSPWNKSSTGRNAYLLKRDRALQTEAHLVEIDLLRGGKRLPMGERLPEADYFALVCRRELRSHAEVYRWRLRDKLPTIPIPLAAGDPDAALDLQTVFTETYDKAGYDYSLDYDQEVEPPLATTDAAWVKERLASPGAPK